MADTVNFISRVHSVMGLNREAVSDMASLHLMVFIRHQRLYRDTLGKLHTLGDSPLSLAPLRVHCFHVSRLAQAGAMTSVLCDALDPVADDAALRVLALQLRRCFSSTGSLHLAAEIELVRGTVVDLDAVEMVKADCEAERCSVCLEDLCGKLIRTPCSHLYHEDCLVSWLEKDNKSCPLCRTQLL